MELLKAIVIMFIVLYCADEEMEKPIAMVIPTGPRVVMKHNVLGCRNASQ